MVKSLFRREKVAYLTDRGQYIYFGSKAKPSDAVVRDTTILDLQVNYYNRMLKTIADHKLECFIVIFPMRYGKYNNLPEEHITRVNCLIKSKDFNNVNVFNIVRDKMFLDINLFIYICYYTKEGADLFLLVSMN